LAGGRAAPDGRAGRLPAGDLFDVDAVDGLRWAMACLRQ
jgi:hypothetical protein